MTRVLYNKLGLETAAELEAAEREITHAALILLDERPVPASYDLPHLRAIHKRIFGDIYEWAGQLRTVVRPTGRMGLGGLRWLPRGGGRRRCRMTRRRTVVEERVEVIDSVADPAWRRD